MTAVLHSRVYPTPPMHGMTPLASTPRPIPPNHAHTHSHPHPNAVASSSNSASFSQSRRTGPAPCTPKVNLAEEEDASDYRPGGYHPVHIMDSLSNGRYLVLRKMGWGHFSTVWLAKDSETNQHVALKIMKSSRRYTETALDEIKLLQHCRDVNPSHPGHNHVVTFVDSFMHMGVHDQHHVCMTFEPLGENLLSLTQRWVKQNKLTISQLSREHRQLVSPPATSTSRRNNISLASLIDLAVPPAIVKIIAKQVLLGVQYLHEECKLIHTDLKPENVLVALEDVERVVREELEIVPTSESIKASTKTMIGVPAGYDRQRSPSSLHFGSNAMNQVYIFSSQPLSSPSRTPVSGSLQNSPMERLLALRMSALNVNNGNGALASTMSPPPTPAPVVTPTPRPIQAPLSPMPLLPPPSGLEVGSGAATTATARALATATMMSSSPSGVSAAELMANARAGTSGGSMLSTPNLPLVEDTTDDESSPPSPSTPLSQMDDASSYVSKTTMATTPATSFVPPRIMKTAATEDDEETQTVMGGDLGVNSRDRTPLAGTASPMPQPGTGPSLLSRTAPRTLASEPISVISIAATAVSAVSISTDSTPKQSDSQSPTVPSMGPILSSLGPPSSTDASSALINDSCSPPPFHVKIADLGNATPINKKFTNDIQTRQYRSPEAILGMPVWDEKVDIFSIACLVFELLTGEYLFNPKSRSGGWTKDDDHVAQMVELMGRKGDDGFTKEMKMEGRYSREIWKSNGTLRNIAKLHSWPLAQVMMDKYDYTREEADLFASFMNPMLAIDPKKRANARDMLDHPWLSS
ncbi:serine/threonine protein kinase, CMGC group [Tulasnella sp. JGI-2019a]|nr:serine/threonine protein kinase, CMGC group [Tulasnella sp. JGI-2019a]